MSTLRLLIVNSCPEFCLATAACLQDSFQIQLCHDGNQALAHLRQQRYHLLLIDLSLPGLDGLNVITAAQAESILPATLVTSDLHSSYVNRALSQLQVCYAIRTPCAAPSVAAILRDIADIVPTPVKVASPVDPDAAATLLRKLLFNPKHSGYQYLKLAIPRFAENPDQFMTKELYAAVGKPYGKTMSQVERAMRTAIQAAWNADTAGIWQTYFPDMLARPANRSFIGAVAQLLYPNGCSKAC